MGREKEYRQRLKYQVSCVRRKTLENQIAVKLQEELGLSPAESRLLSRRMARWLRERSGFRAPNEIVIEASAGRDRFVRNGRGPVKEVRLSTYEEEDLELELELEFGLKTMQAGRIARMTEQVYDQNGLLSVRRLTWLTNITPTSLRARLAAFRELGIYVPYLGLSLAERKKPAVLRSTWTLRGYAAGKNVTEIRKDAAIGKGHFSDLLHRFSVFAADPASFRLATDREREEWLDLLKGLPSADLKELFPAVEAGMRGRQEDDLSFELKTEFAMPPVKVQATREFLRELEEHLSEQRAEKKVVYWAVASHEPAGKPLESCALVPVELTLVDEEDIPDRAQDADFNRVKEMKVKKAGRYATEAKSAGGYLTYADLGFLLGIHPAAISKLLQENAKSVVPLRGFECDIGRGLTHRRKIIELFLEMYTETEIADRTGHSYEAIENYIKEFGTVMLLSEQGLSVPMIRKVTGRSTRLVQAYLDLLAEYSKPAYAFRFNYLRRLVEAGESRSKKGGLEG
jgi:hypothetical protein